MFTRCNERLEGEPGLIDGRSATQTLNQNERKGGVPATVPGCLTAYASTQGRNPRRGCLAKVSAVDSLPMQPREGNGLARGTHRRHPGLERQCGLAIGKRQEG